MKRLAALLLAGLAGSSFPLHSADESIPPAIIKQYRKLEFLPKSIELQPVDGELVFRQETLEENLSRSVTNFVEASSELGKADSASRNQLLATKTHYLHRVGYGLIAAGQFAIKSESLFRLLDTITEKFASEKIPDDVVRPYILMTAIAREAFYSEKHQMPYGDIEVDFTGMTMSGLAREARYQILAREQSGAK